MATTYGMWANGKPPRLGRGHHGGSIPFIPTISNDEGVVMGKNDEKKSKVSIGAKSGGRNAARHNGKAWSRTHRADGDQMGHNPTGRTKPSGQTFGGHKLRVIRTTPVVEVTKSGQSVEAVRASRNTQHRSVLRRARKAEMKARRQAGSGVSRG